jgi:hypothetical protein
MDISNFRRHFEIIRRCVLDSPALKQAMAQKHLQEGVARRMVMMRENEERIEAIAPADRTTVLTSEEALDVNIHLNSYYLHLRGALDNLAWAIHYEHSLLGLGNEGDATVRRQIGLFDTRFRKALALSVPSLNKIIANHDAWHDELREFRDPVAHRIPLYAAPGVLTKGSDEEAKVRQLHQQAHDLMNDRPPTMMSPTRWLN